MHIYPIPGGKGGTEGRNEWGPDGWENGVRSFVRSFLGNFEDRSDLEVEMSSDQSDVMVLGVSGHGLLDGTLTLDRSDNLLW